MGGETVEDENMWTTNEGEKFTKEILELFLQHYRLSVSLELRALTTSLET